MSYPRPIREIHQIEVTTRCNLRCKYCIVPEQRVQTAFGSIEAKHLEPGDVVYGADGKPRTVISCIEHPEDHCEVKVSNLSLIQVSVGHEMLTKRGFVHAVNLTEDDWICVPQPKLTSAPKRINLLQYSDRYNYMRTPCNDFVTMDEDVAWILGLYTAEGCTGTTGDRANVNTIQLTLGAHELKLLDKAERILRHRFGVEVSKVRQGPVIRLVVRNVRLAAFFAEVLGRKGETKRVPFEALGGKWIGPYLAGWFAGDGHRGRHHASLELSLTTAHERLRDDLVHALLYLGILPSVCTSLHCPSEIDGRQIVSSKPHHQIRILGKRAEVLEGHFSGVSAKRPWLPKKKLRGAVVEAGAFWLKVDSVRRTEKNATVIGVEVDGDHTIVVGHLASHNCPSPNLPRKKEDMTWETFEAAIKLVKHYCNAGTQNELALTGIGEALLHPRFVDMVRVAREAIGPARPLTFSTNGLLFTDEIAEKIKEYRPEVYVSLHHLYKSAPAIEVAKRAGILAGVNAAAATSSFDWAGQIKLYNKIDWAVTAPRTPCEYLRMGWGVILVDGRVASCCLDASGMSALGTIWDKPESLKIGPWGNDVIGCKKCHMTVPPEKDLI